MAIFKFTKKDLKHKNDLARPEDVQIPIEDDYVYENEFYLGVSRIFRLLEYIFIVSTLLFAIGSVAADPQMLSYNNFLTFVKDFNMSAVETKHYTEIVYDTDNTGEILLFKNGAVVPGSDDIFVFGATGRLAYTAKHSFASPRLESSESGALLYDFSSDSYAIYNSYTQIYSGKSESPIYSCSISDSGKYAFVVKNTDGRFGVHVYSESNVKICTFESDKYIVSAKLDKNGEKLTVASFGVSDGKRYALVKVYDCTEGKLLSETERLGEMPLSCGYFDNGNSYFLTDKCIMFFDAEENLAASHEISDVLTVECDKQYLAVTFDKRAEVFLHDGSLLSEYSLKSPITSVTLADDSFFILCGSELFRAKLDSADPSALESMDVGSGYSKVLATSDKNVILCGVSRASLVRFG